jgi:hypothetical protein
MTKWVHTVKPRYIGEAWELQPWPGWCWTALQSLQMKRMGGCCIQPVLKQQMMRNGQAQWKLRHRLLMAQRRRPTNWYTFAMLKIGSTQIAGHFRLPVFWPHPSVAVICCWSFATMSVCIAHLMPRQLLPPPRIIPPKEGIMVDIIIQYTIYHSISSTRILHFYHFLSVYLNMLSRIFM